VLTVTCTGRVLADEPVEIPSDRLDVFLVPKAGQKEFAVAHTDEEFTKMLRLYAPSVQPYHIGRVLQYLDRVTVEPATFESPSGTQL
jgi:hypothetical protein